MTIRVYLLAVALGLASGCVTPAHRHVVPVTVMPGALDFDSGATRGAR